mmetsp:Transcript_5085/g.6447  ORF Transcript_5085/g.6447 Transcript_5085/m.6447 type:complete len:209 (+) Transcript_5085:18-644(+)
MGKGSHGGGAAGAGHSHDTEYPDDNWNLYQHIDRCEVLNAVAPCNAAGLFKPFVRRFDAEPFVLSDADEELLIKVTFVSPVHIRKIMVIGGGEEDQHPSSMKVFVNTVAEDMDFAAAADIEPTQEFDLVPNIEGEGYVVTRQGPFTNVTAITFFMPTNFGADATMLQYMGMQGDHTHDKRKAVDATYELNCVYRDTSVKNEFGAAEGV